MNKIKERSGPMGFQKILVVAIILVSFFLIFSYINDDIKDARTLSLRAAKALENIGSYRFDISSNLTLFNEELQIMSAIGGVDSHHKKLHILINSADRQVEAIAIGDKTYAREGNGPWQIREINEVRIWNDKLTEQRLILENARNVSMSRENGSWLLEIVPEKDDVLQQMRDAGLETSEIGLSKYVMRYWIEPGTYRVQKVLTLTDIEMNFRGMQTSMRLMNVIHLGNYDEKMVFEAPV